MKTQNGKVMVVGGGIAGLTAAWELSRQNIGVELVEKSCFLGGHSLGFTCKATDKCQQCGACSVEEMLANVVDEPLINVHLRTQVTGLQNGDGFTVSLSKSDAGPSASEILKGFSRNNRPLYVAGENATGDIAEGAVKITELGTEGQLKVDAIIVATGFAPFDPTLKKTYGYGQWKNVITGLELEKILRENKSLVRPSDGKTPTKIAFIQCVGSRDKGLGHLWCSQVCCAYAMRMASVVKHDNPETDITMFYIDIQNTGKEFPIFYEDVKSWLKFVRAIPVDIYQVEDDRLKLMQLVEGQDAPAMEEFDLVVLAVGITPGADTSKIAEMFNIAVNQDGFLDDKSGAGGIFVTGTAAGPASIIDTMAGAQKTAYEAMKFLGVTK